MKKYTNIAALMTLMLVFTFTIITSSYANQEESGDKKAEWKAKHEAIVVAIEDADYEAWVAAVADTKFGEKLAEKINEANFPKFVEGHALIKEGKEKIKAGMTIHEELGFKKHGKGEWKKGHYKKHGGKSCSKGSQSEE